MPSRSPAFPASALFYLLLAGCGSRDPWPNRVRLADCPATLHDLPHAAPTESLRADFDTVPEGWHVITGSKDVLAVDPEALRQTLGREDGRSYLTLGGRGGALYQVLNVEGDTPYLFRGTLRARDVVPEKEPFFGARFWVAESSKSGSPGELFGEGRLFDRLHKLPTVAGREGWQEQRTAFRTRPETRTLITACMLAVDEALESGEVDFDRLSVERIDERELWEFEAARAVAAAHRGDVLPPSGAWGARRHVRVMLGGEQRPALLLLPGERLEFELEVPQDDAQLTFGLGPWPTTQRVGSEPLVHWLRIDGRELLRSSNPSGPLAERGWLDATIELTPFAGRRVKLELGVDGPLPGVFGAPQIFTRAAGAPGWNVLFVSIDTLRADRVGAYGATSGATPRLDALAREGLVFEDMSANAPYTLPAHATLFSGQFPSVHGVEDRERLLTPARSPILAGLLAARGYRTQAFVAGGFLTPDFGFDTGFDGFSIVDPLRHTGSRYFEEFRREYPEQSSAQLTAEPGIERIKRWIGTHAAEPFFLFVHTYEVHDYDPPPGTVACAAHGCSSTLTDFRQLLFPKVVESFPGTPADRAHLVHLHDAALRHVDAQLGALVDDLRRLGLLERTLVLVSSDHGEELFERGRLQHGKTLYDELLRIPLIVHVPGRAPGRFTTPAMQVDLAPTILGALGLPIDARMQGVDLLRSAPQERVLWSEVNDHFVQKTSLRSGPWKLVHGPQDVDVRIPNEREWELYDLARDPGELQDRAGADPERLKSLRAQLESFREHLRSTSEALGPLDAAAEVDESTRKLLEHLGY